MPVARVGSQTSLLGDLSQKSRTNCFVAKDEHKVGDVWTDPMPDGKGVITNVLTAGR